jgi:short-subunit dehydrogenase
MARTVLVTGATSGIGLELTRILPADTLIATGRKHERDTPRTMRCDLYCQVNLTDETCAYIIRDFLDIHGIAQLDLLIHNAAVGHYGAFMQQHERSIYELFQVNTLAPITITQALLPYLQQAQGRVVFISSVAANLPTPQYAVYSSSKAALSGFARSLRPELSGEVAVQTIYVGPTATPMHVKSGAPRSRLTHYARPAAVARHIARATLQNRSSVTLGSTNRFIRYGGRVWGGLMDAAMRRWQSRNPA